MSYDATSLVGESSVFKLQNISIKLNSVFKTIWVRYVRKVFQFNNIFIFPRYLVFSLLCIKLRLKKVYACMLYGLARMNTYMTIFPPQRNKKQAN